MFAVIKSGGRQYKVSAGQKLQVNRLPVEDGTQIRFDEVLLISDADTPRIGTPFVDKAEVLATVEKQTRGEKLIVFKYKSKKRYRHRRGHRQELTVLSIDDIIADGKSLITGEAPKTNEDSAASVLNTEIDIETETEMEIVAEEQAESSAEG
jgi:large subunit ribosomal protein L21